MLAGFSNRKQEFEVLKSFSNKKKSESF